MSSASKLSSMALIGVTTLSAFVSALLQQALDAYDAILGALSSPAAAAAVPDAAAAAGHITAAATAMRPLLQQETAVQNK